MRADDNCHNWRENGSKGKDKSLSSQINWINPDGRNCNYPFSHQCVAIKLHKKKSEWSTVYIEGSDVIIKKNLHLLL